jgi:hypothetical protein
MQVCWTQSRWSLWSTLPSAQQVRWGLCFALAWCVLAGSSSTQQPAAGVHVASRVQEVHLCVPASAATDTTCVCSATAEVRKGNGSGVLVSELLTHSRLLFSQTALHVRTDAIDYSQM